MNEIKLWKRLAFVVLTILLIFVVGYIIFTWRNLQG